MLQLSFPTHGGRRKGAGRKPKGRVTHHGRQQFAHVLPSHVTLRIERGLPSLRCSRRFRTIREAFGAARGRHGLRLIEFTVMGNHLHLIVEAESSAALSKGMQGLCIRVAKALNRSLERAGRVFADHYHSHLLKTPRELLHAIRYVLRNARHHYGFEGIDYFSSEGCDSGDTTCEPRGWLLRSAAVREPRVMRARPSYMGDRSPT
jgi:putative transposase